MSAEFDAAVEPLRAVLMKVLEASRTTREGHGFLPEAASPAMSELASEAGYKGAWGDQPVGDAHDWAGVLLAGAEDQLRTTCRIVIGEPSLFGPQSLTRSGLDMAGRAYWLTESGIGVARRVARYQTERLFNAYQLKRLGQTEGATKLEKAITETANALGLEPVRGKGHRHTQILERRPDSTAVFRRLLHDVEQHGLGHTIFSYLSAVDHGTLYGLLQAVRALDRQSLTSERWERS